MAVKQISVFVENTSGRLAKVTKILAEKNIDIQALCIADTTDFGILRMIVNKPDEAKAAIREAGFAVKTTEVIAVSIEDAPGGLHKAMQILAQSDIGIEYMYAFTEKRRNDALVILRVENNDDAAKALTAGGVEVIPGEVIYNL